MGDVAEKAYHRFWAEGRSFGRKAEVDADDLPLWAKGIAALVAVALYMGMVFLIAQGVGYVWFKVQTTHADWCAEAGGKMSVGAFGYVSCYDLTPTKP